MLTWQQVITVCCRLDWFDQRINVAWMCMMSSTCDGAFSFAPCGFLRESHIFSWLHSTCKYYLNFKILTLDINCSFCHIMWPDHFGQWRLWSFLGEVMMAMMFFQGSVSVSMSVCWSVFVFVVFCVLSVLHLSICVQCCSVLRFQWHVSQDMYIIYTKY